jgi:hypothetical protein
MVAKQLKSPNTAEENGLSPLVRQERSNTTNSSKGKLSRKTTYTRIQGNYYKTLISNRDEEKSD